MMRVVTAGMHAVVYPDAHRHCRHAGEATLLCASSLPATGGGNTALRVVTAGNGERQHCSAQTALRHAEKEGYPGGVHTVLGSHHAVQSCRTYRPGYTAVLHGEPGPGTRHQRWCPDAALTRPVTELSVTVVRLTVRRCNTFCCFLSVLPLARGCFAHRRAEHARRCPSGCRNMLETV